MDLEKIAPADPADQRALDNSQPAVTREISTAEAGEAISICADTGAALDFLKRFAPKGPWPLTALDPETKVTNTRTFAPDTAIAAERWIAEQNQTRNVYYMVNTPRAELTKKASKADVARADWLHVDVDPRAGEDPVKERDRILRTLRAFEPAPTVIVFSGGGFNALFRLTAAVVIDSDAALAEIEGRNLGLEVALGADHCHNIDRILRLPGTVNWPDARKRKRGRTPALARVEDWHDDREYPIEDFAKATVSPGKQRRAKAPAAAPVEVPRLASVDALPAAVKPYTRMLIVQGDDPDNPAKFAGDRSRVLWRVCCDLVRAGLDDAAILGIITDPAYEISASVIDKKGGAERYALKQVHDARAEADHPELAELNARHAVIQSVGGKTKVANFRHDPATGRDVMDFQSFDDIRNFYRNRFVQVGVKDDGTPAMKPMGAWWVDHPARRQYTALTFAPGKEVPDHLNLWRGFGVAPARGSWRLMRRHVWDILANRDPAAFKYIMRWAAWAVQNPDKQAEVALAFRGGRGTGKGTFGRAMARLFGQHGLHISSSGHFTGRFNNHLRDVCLLFADEAYAPEERQAESRLKALITEPTMTIEAKGVDVIEVPNHLHVIIASNEGWVVPAGTDERRFAVFNISPRRRGQHPYFQALHAELEAGGLAAMLHDLMRINVGDWHPRKGVPENAALRQQKARTLKGVERVWLSMLEIGHLPKPRAVGNAGELVATMDLVTFMRAQLRRDDLSSTEVGSLMNRFGFEKRTNTRPRGYLIPPLRAARAAWDRVMFKYDDWDDAASWCEVEQGPF